MTWTSNLTIAAVAALLATGVAACGDDDDTTKPSATQPEARSGYSSSKKPGEGSGKSKAADEKGADKSKGADEEGKSSTSGPDRGDDLGNFVPKQHSDSGGGAAKFRVKGGDNSVQEYGEEAAGSDFEEVSTALHNFLDARAIGDWTAACNYLASSLVESLEKLAQQSKEGSAMDCGEMLGSLTNPAAKAELLKEAEMADVGSVRVEGDRAFVIYRSYEDLVMAISMVNEDGGWKVASLGGIPLN